MTARNRIVAGVVAAAGLLLVAGCSNASSGTAAPGSPGGAQHSVSTGRAVDYGQQYLDAVKSLNAILATMATQMKAAPASATGPEVAKVTAPGARALRDTAQRLSGLSWPESVQPDIKTLATAQLAMATVLDTVATQNASSVAGWIKQLGVESENVAAAVSAVRMDLGLPPATK